jgi:pimeloyl-ACP methyl ester carboxylesterase
VDAPDAHRFPEAPLAFGSGLFTAAAALDAALGDRDWSVLPSGAESGWREVPSGRLAFVALGDRANPRVLLVPGATGSKEDFALMLPLLAAAGYRAESFDLAGQYESAAAGPERLRPPRHRYEYSLFVDDLITIVESGRTPVHMLGYSFAATVAQIALAQRPDLFASLTLLSAPPRPGQGFLGIKWIGRASSLASDRIGASLMIWGVRHNLNRAPPGRVELVHKRFLQTRRASVDDIIALMKRAPDMRAAVAATPIPKLVAVGEHDLWPLALHRNLAREIGASIAVYRTGHSPCEESPHQLVRDLLALFDRSRLRA